MFLLPDLSFRIGAFKLANQRIQTVVGLLELLGCSVYKPPGAFQGLKPNTQGFDFSFVRLIEMFRLRQFRHGCVQFLVGSLQLLKQFDLVQLGLGVNAKLTPDSTVFYNGRHSYCRAVNSKCETGSYTHDA